MRYHGTKCPLLTAFFLSPFSLFYRVTFIPEWVIRGFRNFAWGLKAHKKSDLGYKTIGGTPSAPLWVDFLWCVFSEKNEKCLELPEMARKFIVFLPPPDNTICYIL
jgi:hypothetical protein